MSFTTIDIVRMHLLENHIAVSDIDSEPVKLAADTSGQLRYPPVNKESETVKAKEQIKPDFYQAMFGTDDKITLPKGDLIRDSVVVASDSSLGQIYKENIDYSADYNAGVITRITDGAIPAGSVAIWYMPYRVYTRGADYQIDYETGRLTRISSGEIEAGQWLYVDYISEYAFVDDDTIKNAISEANEQVLNFIDSVYSSSTDKSLVIAETYLAIAIICRIKALWSVSSGLKNQSGSSWSVLADQYKKDGYIFLEKFIGSLGSFKSPRKA